MRRLVRSIPEDAQKYVRATLGQINNQLRICRLTRFSEYETDRATQRHPRFQCGGLEQFSKGTAFIQEEEDQFVTNGPAIEKGKRNGAGRECVRRLESVVQSDHGDDPWTLSQKRGR